MPTIDQRTNFSSIFFGPAYGDLLPTQVMGSKCGQQLAVESKSVLEKKGGDLPVCVTRDDFGPTLQISTFQPEDQTGDGEEGVVGDLAQQAFPDSAVTGAFADADRGSPVFNRCPDQAEHVGCADASVGIHERKPFRHGVPCPCLSDDRSFSTVCVCMVKVDLGIDVRERSCERNESFFLGFRRAVVGDGPVHPKLRRCQLGCERWSIGGKAIGVIPYGSDQVDGNGDAHYGRPRNKP